MGVWVYVCLCVCVSTVLISLTIEVFCVMRQEKEDEGFFRIGMKLYSIFLKKWNNIAVIYFQKYESGSVKCTIQNVFLQYL